MALIENILEQYQYIDLWCVRINLTDDITSQIYYHEISFDHEPTSMEKDAEIARLKELTQFEIDCSANNMNLTVDEEMALQYLRNIKTDIIIQIRTFPAVTLIQAQDFVDTTYPNSVVKFEVLYQFYLNLLNLSTWGEFKTFIIDNKFRGID